MKTNLFLKGCSRWLNVPTLSLLALLQRTPVVQMAANAEKFVLSSPIGAVLKSLAATAASLGAMNSLVGATPLVPSSGTEAGVTVTVGSPVSIAYTVTPTQTPIMSWNLSGSVPPGLNFSSLTTAGSVNTQSLTLGGTPTTAGSYPVTIQAFDAVNNGGFASAIYSYTITVNGGAATAPSITTQPQTQTVSVGANVTFSVAVSGNPTPTLQWRKGTSALTGETATSLVLNNVQTGAAGTYTVVATNSAGSITSNDAILTVNPVLPPLPSAPASAGGFASGAAEVTLSWLAPASGSVVTGYKVERATNGVFSAGLTTFDLNTTSTTYVDTTTATNSTYFYRISSVNSAGASTPTAAIQVATAPVNSGATAFANIATRAFCGTGNSVTIGGFVVTGTVPKRVLVRAVGPTLTSQGIGVSEVLADPSIEVHQGSPIIASNDNWGDNSNAAEITTTASLIGASPLAGGDSKSSALLLALNPGVYSFVASGKGGTSGIVLLEVYDADAAPGGASFANIATRAFSTTGNGVTIGGFVVTGGVPKQVLLRAVGPTLTTQGIGQSEVLTDPTIELHRGAPIIAINDNWGDNANAADISTTSSRIGATPLNGSDTKSAALLVKLLPGAYSFVARGKVEPSGIVLVEIYDAD